MNKADTIMLSDHVAQRFHYSKVVSVLEDSKGRLILNYLDVAL